MSGICRPLATRYDINGEDFNVSVGFSSLDLWRFEQDRTHEDRILVKRDKLTIGLTVAEFSRAFEILSRE